MFHLVANDIHIQQKAKNKTDAIQQIAAALVAAGYVETNYADGMQERETQTVTYLGKGIAIPHGTTATRQLVKKTGVQVFHFPEGVVWGDEGELAYVAIGIAASSDEHLALLRQLTHVLLDDQVETRVHQIQTAEDVIAILTGAAPATADGFKVDPALFLLDIPVTDIAALQALNASRLLQAGAVNSEFAADVLAQTPSYLGHGIWLSDSTIGNLKNALAISRPQTPLQFQQQPVQLLISAAAVDQTLQPLLQKLAQSLEDSAQASALTQADTAALVAFFTPIPVRKGHWREYEVISPDGIHARPSALLANAAKQFQSEITLQNLTDNSTTVSAKELTRILSLGVGGAHRVLIQASGADAEAALDAITTVMNDQFALKEQS